MNNLKILIVDDDEEMIDILTRLLKRKYTVFGVTSAREAIKLIEEKAFNLVITDICMPDMNGLELMRWIKEYNGSIQIIAMTGFTSLFNVLESHRRGAYNFFFKPFEDLEPILRTVVSIDESFKRWRHLAAIAKEE